MAPTCFGLRPSSGSLQLILAKVILVLRHSVKLLFGGVAACLIVTCVLCSVQSNVLFIFGCLQHWCTLSCLVMWLPSSSVCTRDDPFIRPNCAISRIFSHYIRSQKTCSRGCKTTSRPCGHWTMVSTFMRWVCCVSWLHQVACVLTLFCSHYSCLLWCDTKCSDRWTPTIWKDIPLNTMRTGLLNCLNARSRGLTFRHHAYCI